MSETVPDSFLRGLAAAAVEPGLRQVLLFDADFTMLETAVSLMQQLLTLTTKQHVKVIPLHGLVQEDDLWGSYMPVSQPDNTNGLPIAWQDGWLTQNRNDESWLLVVIPDLTRLSLASSRAFISLLDTPVAHLERHSQQTPWQPRICWIAACARDEVGKVSPHLLDRFTLRLPAPQLHPTSSASILLDWLQKTERPIDQFNTSTLPDVWRKKVTNEQPLPSLTQPAIERVVAYSDNLTHHGVRRELALARLGRVMAWWGEETAVTSDHIEEAAKLIGLTLPQLPADPTKDEPPKTEPDPLPPLPDPSLPQPDTLVSDNTPLPEPSRVIAPDEPEVMPPSSLPPVSPYPEDQMPVDRELFVLQLPLRRQRVSANEHGSIIGIQPANSLQDMALVATILEAALYQKVRRKNTQDKVNRFILSPADLRRYRRIPQPEKMLLLLLDYTSLHDCEWQQALVSHLRWAYVNRASINIIQVGSAKAENELRAQKISARSLLTPRIAEALEPQAGRATPLAHGLEMAYQVMQQAQQHGRSLIQETRFVIITDGRGNVPLAASASGQVKMPVNREGIEDALQVAHYFLGMNRLQTFLLDPQPQYHAELPFSLAEMLGAQHDVVPLVSEAQI